MLKHKTMSIEIKGNLAPAIINVRSKTYVVSGNCPWVEVPTDTVLEDIKWVDPYEKHMEARKNRK